MSSSSVGTERPACFQFKASFAPCAILQLTRYDLDALEHQLVESIRRAPNFFIGSPVLIDLEKLQSIGMVDFNRIKQILISNALAPIGVRGGSLEQQTAAATAGLPLVNIGKSSMSESSKKKEDEAPQKKTEEHFAQAKIVTSPIRSGMQVYAKGGDLIVVAQVSAGAELLADGNIHVYGALRGRALAGVQGNVNARIFCQTLEAELVSIAGFYLTKEEMQPLVKSDGMIQIFLTNEKICVQSIHAEK